MPTKAKKSSSRKGSKGGRASERPTKLRASKTVTEHAAAAEPADEIDESLEETAADLEKDEEEAPAAPRPAPRRATGPADKNRTEVAAAPVRRLTPAARQQINALVAKGMPLDQALRAAASWEMVEQPPPSPAALAPGPSPFRVRHREDDEEEGGREPNDEAADREADGGDE